MKNNFDKVQFWQPNILKGIAERYRGVFIQRVRDGKDYKGQRFKRYSSGYTKLLQNDFRKKSGGRYKGYEGISLETGGSKTSKRPLFLRGISVPAIKVKKATKDSVTIGWDGEAGAIIEGQANKGRDIINDIPPKEKTWWIRELGKEIDKQFKKIPDVINIR